MRSSYIILGCVLIIVLKSLMYFVGVFFEFIYFGVGICINFLLRIKKYLYFNYIVMNFKIIIEL